MTVADRIGGTFTCSPPSLLRRPEMLTVKLASATFVCGQTRRNNSFLLSGSSLYTFGVRGTGSPRRKSKRRTASN